MFYCMFYFTCDRSFSSCRIRPPAAMAGGRQTGVRQASGVVCAWRRWRRTTAFSTVSVCILTPAFNVLFYLNCSPLNGRAVLGAEEYGNATEGYWFSDVQCTGSEINITSCRRSQWGDDGGCDITEPAGVSCLLDTPTPPPRTVAFCFICSSVIHLEIEFVKLYFRGPAQSDILSPSPP